MPSRRRTAHLALGSAVAAIALLGAPAVAVAAPPEYTPGSDGAGDPYFPLAGNGGFNVLHYDLDLDYTPAPPAPAPIEGRLDHYATGGSGCRKPLKDEGAHRVRKALRLFKEVPPPSAP